MRGQIDRDTVLNVYYSWRNVRSFMKTGAPVDKGKCLSYIDSYKKFKASRICVQWCIIIGSLI